MSALFLLGFHGVPVSRAYRRPSQQEALRVFALFLSLQLALGHHEAYPAENDTRSKPQKRWRADERRNGAPELHQIQQVHHADADHGQQREGHDRLVQQNAWRKCRLGPDNGLQHRSAGDCQHGRFQAVDAGRKRQTTVGGDRGLDGSRDPNDDRRNVRFEMPNLRLQRNIERGAYAASCEFTHRPGKLFIRRH
uniref:Putative secreted protein n=1 Tax=Anopheles marajoara TaxID=58244 RepID=A0A2M4C5U0_9DIPT